MEYSKGEHVLIIADTTVYTVSTNRYTTQWIDAGYPKVTVVDPAGETVLDAQEMSQSTTVGKYYYDFALPSDADAGVWNVCIESRIDGKVSKHQDFFSVLKEGACL